MEIEYSPRFRRTLKKQPVEVKILMRDKLRIFINDPFDSRLRTHKLTGDFADCWAIWISYRYRIIFMYGDKGQVILLAIGDHSVYR